MSKMAQCLGAMVLVLCSACSSRVWQYRGDITPTSYQRIDGRIERSVGKLRRLAVAPIRFQNVLDIWEGWPTEPRKVEQQAEVTGRVMSATLSWLSARGYEAAPLDLHEVLYLEKLGLTPERVTEQLDTLVAWMRSSDDGAQPPESTAEIVRRLGRPLNVDGIVVVEGIRRPPNITATLAVLTASLSWPLVFFEGKVEMRADIYEVATGKVVWRGKAREFYGASVFKSQGLVGSVPARLFGELEHAVPRVLVEE